MFELCMLNYVLIGEACFDTNNGKKDGEQGLPCHGRVYETNENNGGLSTFECDNDYDYDNPRQLRTSAFDAKQMCCSCGGGASKS